MKFSFSPNSLFRTLEPLRYHCMDEEQRNLPSAFVVYSKSMNEPPSTFCWVGVDGYTLGRIDLSAEDAYDMVIEEAHVQSVILSSSLKFSLFLNE